MVPQNEDLPGVEGEGVSIPRVKKIDDEFANLLAHRKKRMDHGEKEQASSAVLTQLFHKHNLTVYVYDDVKYKLVGKEKIVKAPKDVDGEED